ncbi:MAG: pimeloyl-ACP methyl ester carboxylesterase [Porticoccaceae bacterium]|jgi:pimeloyl-ACP methyl ester carboxylesterase|tara:strand:- start:360 stop:1193 length:834 start_codon:yes stop_codon:yes gene_type:complete
MIRRNYLTVGDQKAETQRQIHYRETGAGTPIVLLHPSPASSIFMEPLMTLFAKYGRAIAWDTPGYGQSDKLLCDRLGLEPYVQAMDEFIVGLGLDKPVIYGSATGAQLAIEYGKAYPENTRGVLLDNAAWFYDDERDAIMESYFPDISARQDGSHLQLVWEMATQVYRYFPWYDTLATVKNSAEIPLSIVQQTALDYLNAGTDYDRAYRAAFINERPEQLYGLQIPARLMRWQDSMLKDYTDRLDKADLPENIKMCHAESGKENRLSVLEKALTELL